MEQFRLNGLITDTMVLMRRHGLDIYIQFMLAGVLVTTHFALADPERMRAQMTGALQPDEDAAIVELVLFNPGSYITSAIYTCVMATAFLRLWRQEFGLPDLPEGAMKARLIVLVFLQMIADIAFTLSLLVFLPLSAFVAVMTMGLVPAILLEGRGSGAFARSVQIAWPRVLLYTVIWLLLVFLWVIAILVPDPSGPALVGSSDTALWLMAIASDALAPIFSAMSLCLTAAIYRQFIDAESGSGPDLADIFR